MSHRHGAVSPAASQAGTGFAMGQLCCSYAKGSPNKKIRFLVSIALQNFTSEAETKGKTHQKDIDAMPAMGSVGGKEE